MPTTVVIGASPDSSRASFQVVTSLLANKEHVIAVGIKKGIINGQEILLGFPKIKDVDTVSLYVGPANQAHWEDYILSLKPRRIIFNPGTENPAFHERAVKQGIEPLEACTLTMLAVGNYWISY